MSELRSRRSAKRQRQQTANEKQRLGAQKNMQTMRIFIPDGREILIDRKRYSGSQIVDPEAAGKGKHSSNQGTGGKTQDQAYGRVGGRGVWKRGYSEYSVVYG